MERSQQPSGVGRGAPTGADERPLAGYAVLGTAFVLFVSGGLLAGRRAGRRLPDTIGARDLALIAVATQRLSRLLAKDKVAAFLRAPFTSYRRPAGHGEVEEAPRGGGQLRRAVGELLLCPFCLSQWIAAALVGGLALAPRPTRFIAAMISAKAGADALQLAYRAAEERS